MGLFNLGLLVTLCVKSLAPAALLQQFKKNELRELFKFLSIHTLIAPKGQTRASVFQLQLLLSL